MSKPNAKGPVTTVQIFCSKCKQQLYKYRKGGKGTLIKCFKSRIAENYTKEDGICPSCGRQFARNALIRGEPALKMIGGKVTMK